MRQRGNVDIDIDSLTRRVMKILVRQPKAQLQNSRFGLRWELPDLYSAPGPGNANAFKTGAVQLGRAKHHKLGIHAKAHRLSFTRLQKTCDQVAASSSTPLSAASIKDRWTSPGTVS